MKLLVFAHTPPPHHGQSYMVQLMLEGLGGDWRKRANRLAKGSGAHPLGIECYHVNVRLSKKLEEIGGIRVWKFVLLLWYCLEAIWCRFRYGVTNFYYIPAPGKRIALYRDWFVMLLCRPFFKRVALHWHAAGLGKWLETVVLGRTRSWTYYFMKQVDLSIVLSRYNRADAEKLFPKRVKVVSNGIPDPCPRFEQEVLPLRLERFAARKKLLSTATGGANAGGPAHVVKALYLAHCTREKGLFDAVQAVLLANQRLAAAKSPVSIRLLVAGVFVSQNEKREFDQLLNQPGGREAVEYLGFVSGPQKEQVLREVDVFCFPTYYQNENQPVNLIEAMAFGLPILTTRWRSIPEIFPAHYSGLVEIRSPDQAAQALLELMANESGQAFRQYFLRHFTLEQHLASLAEALHSIEEFRLDPMEAGNMLKVT